MSKNKHKCYGHLAKIVKGERTYSNLTQQEMADKISISRGFYSEIELNVTSVSVHTLVHISQALQLPTDVLLGLRQKGGSK